MAIMPGLQINIGQQLKLTPQLQQSIKILQYSALEVQQTIEATLETNFMLEIDDLLEDEEELDEQQQTDPEPQEAEQVDADAAQELDLDKDVTEIDDAYDAEYSWDDLYSDRQTTSQASSSFDDEYTAPENYTADQKSLHDHLNWQIDTYPWSSEVEQTIAYFITDAITDDGYLHTELADILVAIKRNKPGLVVKLQDVERVLSIVHQFEPSGIGARSIQESLLLQLSHLPSTSYHISAAQLIKENFDWLTLHEHNRIKKAYGLDDVQLDTLLGCIQSLNPRPGREFAATQADFIVPDLRLSRARLGWLVELNPDAFPRLSVNKAYIEMSDQIKDTKQLKQVREQLNEARGLIKSVQSRGETLLRVGRYVVERQQRFFEEGEQAMQPLVLREVAEFLDLHESTISRATNQKYMQTPRGTFELKYFFSTGVSQDGSDDQSAIAIKAHIKDLIEQEDAKKPLSDKRLMELLEEKDINVARRTIAKYREAVGIPSSSERRKLGRFR